MIACRALQVRRGDRTLVGPVDLAVAPGEALLLSGSSGSGKSTLLRALAGILPPEFQVDGVRETVRTGYVPQNPSHALLCARVGEEVSAAGRNFGLDDPGGRGRAALEELGAAHLSGRLCRELSSGEAQRVALATAVAGGAQTLLLDEPTAFLDPSGITRLGEALQRLKSHGIGLLVAEHRPERLSGLFDRTMSLGSLPASQAPASLAAARPTPELGPVLLRARGIAHSFEGRRVLEGLDLELLMGERVAILGPNGAGKTTLGRLLTGLLRPQRGRIESGNGGRVRPGFEAGFTPPDPDEALLGETVAEEVRLGPENLGLTSNPNLLATLGLQDRAEEAPVALSHGARVRLVIGATLATNPAVLVLDEPTVGADAASLDRLLGLLWETKATVVALTHDAPFAERFATRSLRLEGGRLIG